MNAKRIAAAVALAFAAGSAAAADLLNIYRDAVVSDPVFQSSRAVYNAGVERLPQARSGYLPNIGASGQIFRNGLEGGGDGYTTQTYAIELSQPLFRMQNWIAISQAQQQLLQAEANFNTAKQDLILRVSQAYFDVLLAQDNVAFSESQKGAISEQLAQAKRNFEVGTATIVDQLESQARYDQSVAKEIFDRNDLEVKKRALTQLVGKPVDALAPLRGGLVLAEPRPGNIEAWVTAAGDSSFAIAVARAGTEIARQEVDRAKAGHLPTVDLAAAYVRNKNPILPAPLNSSNSGQVGVVVALPLFTGGLTQSRIREALALREKSEQDLENTQRSVAQSVRQNYLNVTSGIALVRALEQALTSTTSQLDSTILGRDVGVRTSVDVLNAQQQVVQARRDLQQARYAYLMNTLRLKAASGTLSEADVEEVNRALARA